MNWAIRVDNVSKRYPGASPRYATLRDELARAGRRALASLRRTAAESAGVLALDAVSFEVEQGEAFAIIGPNGAGKTTTLKLLTRVTYPTSGRIYVRGRIGALIDVGAGVHPELTGRENIWLYGRILGMSRREVWQRFDAIVDFAELGAALDMPVKTYSSGMQLRLGFAIASHIEPDIFVVDEALAVGDAGFQAKCVKRMMQLVAAGGTLLFVSHDLVAVEAVCQRALFLLNGRIEHIGVTRDVLRGYVNWVDERERQRRGTGVELKGRGIHVERVTLHDVSGRERYVFDPGEALEVRFHIQAEEEIEKPWFSLGINDGRPGALVFCSMLEQDGSFRISPGFHVVRCNIGPLPLVPRTYELWMSVRERFGAAHLVDWSPVGALRIRIPEQDQGVVGATASWLYGSVRVPYQWRLDGE